VAGVSIVQKGFRCISEGLWVKAKNKILMQLWMAGTILDWDRYPKDLQGYWQQN